MPDLKFATLLPWLLLDEGASVSGFELVPYRRGSPIPNVDTEIADTLDEALSCYIGPDLRPVDQVTLLRYAERDLVCALSRDEQQAILEFSELLSVAGLSARELCSHFSYWNRDHFRVKFEVLTGASGFVSVSSRRRDGTHIDMGTRERAHVCRPSHVRSDTVSLDMPLLHSLVGNQSHDSWPRVLESLVNFNAANTDDGYMSARTELVLLSGAMERLLGATHGKENDLAERFSASFPCQAPRPISDCPRLNRSGVSDRFPRASSSVEVWIRDLFRLRGDLAHGRVSEKYPAVWEASEHLALGSVAYPLLLKSVLSNAGAYELTHEDRCQAHAFECLLCLSSLDHESWARVSQEAAWNQGKRDAVRELEAMSEGGGT